MPGEKFGNYCEDYAEVMHIVYIYLYIPDTNPLSGMWFANILSQFGLSSILSTVYAHFKLIRLFSSFRFAESSSMCT